MENERVRDIEGHFRRYTAEVIKQSFGVRVAQEAWRFRAWEDVVTRDLIFRVELFLASDKKTRYVPKTWWDHVKHRFAPVWFLRRWPVQYETITTLRICPHVETRKQPHVEFLMYGDLREVMNER